MAIPSWTCLKVHPFLPVVEAPKMNSSGPPKLTFNKHRPWKINALEDERSCIFWWPKKSRLFFLVVLSVRVTTLFKWKFPTKSMDSYPTIREWPWPEVVSPTAQWAQHLPGRWHCPAATRNCASTKHWQRSPRIVRTLGSWVQTRGGDSTEFLTTSKCVDETFIKTCLHEQVPVVCWTRSLGKFFWNQQPTCCGHYLTQRAPNNARLLVRKKSDPTSYWGKRSIFKSFCC